MPDSVAVTEPRESRGIGKISTRMADASTATLLIVTVCALLIGIGLSAAGLTTAAQWSWTGATLVATVPALWWVVAAVRHGKLGVDAIAVFALVGALLVGEYLAGALIATMLATGRALDTAASRRATRDLRALLDRAPRTARRISVAGIETVPIDEVVPGDVLAVGPGETIPVDGEIASPLAVLDESALTGEPLQVRLAAGSRARSGAVNAGSAFELQALVTAADSTYAGIVRLAKEAAAETAPSYGWPTGSLHGFCRSRSQLPASRGLPPASPFVPSLYWSSRRPARCCSQCLSRSFPGSRGRRASASWFAAVGR